MALSANTVWEVRGATGAVTNGGGYVTGSGTTDYSQQPGAQIAVVDAVANGTTTITSATDTIAAIHHVMAKKCASTAPPPMAAYIAMASTRRVMNAFEKSTRLALIFASSSPTVPTLARRTP